MTEYVAPVPRIWPAAVKRPSEPDWESTALAWLLSFGFGVDQLRATNALILARETQLGLVQRQVMLRLAYKNARQDLVGLVEDELVEQLMAAYVAEGEKIGDLVRQVDVVQQALEGTRWRSSEHTR